MGKPYDRQLIILFLNGSTTDNKLKKEADALNTKAKQKGLKSTIVTMPYLCETSGFDYARTTWALRGDVTADTRLYLVGDGNWRFQHLGNYSAFNAADFLAEYITQVRKISIVGCCLGKDRGFGSGQYQISMDTADSFASKFHARLKKHGIKTQVAARVEVGLTITEDFAEPMGYGNDWIGRKVTVLGNDENSFLSHRKSFNKLLYYWDGDRQMRQWVYT